LFGWPQFGQIDFNEIAGCTDARIGIHLIYQRPGSRGGTYCSYRRSRGVQETPAIYGLCRGAHKIAFDPLRVLPSGRSNRAIAR
jgi:hypothetical protein